MAMLACNDDDGQQRVPVVPVDITIAIDLPLYSTLENPGGWVYLQGGSEGIVVYRIGIDEFSAFDRHCTFQVENRCRVDVDEDTNVSVDDYACCNAAFNLLDGSPMSGPATRPLLRYQTIFNVNANSLRIYN
jgi:nitrite reductase/ring-hydroxylating ferredoxin subunit